MICFISGDLRHLVRAVFPSYLMEVPTAVSAEVVKEETQTWALASDADRDQPSGIKRILPSNIMMKEDHLLYNNILAVALTNHKMW